MPVSHPMSLDRKVQALRQALGPRIAEALADPRVVEVMVNPDGRIWLDRVGQGRSSDGAEMDPADAERVLRLLADHVGETVTRERPRISATLPVTGERFQGVFMPLVPRPAFTIRKRPSVIFSLADYVRDAVLTADQAATLRAAVDRRDNILIAGGTGSGKTTLANAILAEPAFARDRVIMIEDTVELQCAAIDQVQLLTKRTEPAVTMTDLVRDTLRLRPDRIVVGEVRDGSALDMLKAWNTGHPGGLATVHANGPREALARLEELIGEVTAQIPVQMIGRAIDLVIFIRRTTSGRRVDDILRVHGHGADGYVTERAVS